VALVALIAGQSAGIAGARWSLAPGSDLVGPIADTVAAAALVGIGLQAITHGRTRWAWSIALVYGLAGGLRAGEALRGSLDLAGRHAVVASAAFGLALAVGQVWVVLLVRSMSQAVSRWTAHERVVAIAAAVPVVHAGMHALVSSKQALQGVEWPRLDVPHLVLISCWAMALVLTGLVMAQLARRVDPPGGLLTDSGSHAG
jgi:type IV secretory pathway VirB2 component (pilin)